jgi:V/A-type H+-transporting ATPase subunit I
MKRLSFLAAKSQREELLRELMLLDCVEISSPEAPSQGDEQSPLLSKALAGASERKSECELLLRAIVLLDRYAPKKGGLLTPRPIVDQNMIFDETENAAILALAAELDEKEGAIRSADAEMSRLRSVAESLEPWKDSRVPLDLSETATCYVISGMVPAAAQTKELSKALDEAGCESAVYQASEDKSTRYVTLLLMKDKHQAALEALRVFGFSQTSLTGLKGTPGENIVRIESELEELEKSKAAKIDDIRHRGDRRAELRLCYDRIMTKLETAENAERLLYTKSVFTFEGWIPVERMTMFEMVLADYDCAWEMSDPVEEDFPEVPVKLKNGKLTRSLNMVTEMYSLPSYGNVDPNPLIAPFFILFYGIMMADMGYGLLMLIAGILITKKKRPRTTVGYMFELMIPAGAMTFIMGAVTGGFFGDFIPQLIKLFNPASTFVWFYKPLFTPLDDTIMILLGSMALGFVQLMTGTIISFVHKVKHGKFMDGFWDEISWWIVFVGIGLAVAGIGTVGGVPVVLAVGFLIVIVGAGRDKKGMGKVSAAFAALYNGVTGWFGDILSYSRLMALMLAGSVIAQVFNTLGGITGSVIAFTVISLFGNLLNFSLNLLGCFVHDLRLQCLEYFGKFYEDGGRPFKPLGIKTQYYDVVK